MCSRHRSEGERYKDNGGIEYQDIVLFLMSEGKRYKNNVGIEYIKTLSFLFGKARPISASFLNSYLRKRISQSSWLD